MHRILSLSLVLLYITSCRPHNQPSTPTGDLSTDHPQYVEDIEQAHHKSTLLSHEAICYNLNLTFGNNTSTYKIVTTPNSSDIRMERPDGSLTIVNNGELYTNVDTSLWKREKFAIYTWQYFFMAPYKLSDKGTQWEKLAPKVLEDKRYHTAMLTFESGTGDAPDDWYMIHSDTSSNLITYLGYIVTATGATPEEAEKNARVAKYLDYEPLDNIPISRKWEFHNYSRSDGVGRHLGTVDVTNVMFVDVLDETFHVSDLDKITL